MGFVEALKSNADRYAHLRMKAMKIVDDFLKPVEMYTIASTNLEKWYNELDEIAKSMRCDTSTEHDGASIVKQPWQSDEAVEEINYQDPPQSQCKGKRRPERFKHPIEKKLRTCTICHLKVGHNARSCPQRFSDQELKVGLESTSMRCAID